ncbi:FecR family protein [Pedobacter metabolipauper]|uniref:FecR family protein n=1 Tax=Pedobacter metabolipauper TaxID=425513 RepID=A0A4V3D1I9_9SPHI|nr:FecR family protein [Pedobacter metabolipauper]TDQ11293.1 FecR family protein [Pedobacter metabolipauper]
MTREEYITLYEKYLSGECTESEIQQLEAFKDDFSLSDMEWNDLHLGDEREIMNRIHQRLVFSIKDRPVQRLKRYRISIAAALILISLSAVFYLYSNQQTEILEQSAAINVAPGSNKAILTLDDGSTIVLDQSNAGVLAQQGTAVIRKESGGKLVYNASAQHPDQPVKYNSIVIPRGGQYQLVLPDGTLVMLNAESSLRFPVIFNGNHRQVELKGEAYFEVAKNKAKPFKIKTHGVDIEVLGTHFNVNSYRNEINTTLLEGSVKLKSAKDAVVLKPGQSGVLENGSHLVVKVADLESVMAWKNGYFVFHDETVRSIMEKAARWYDVDVEYKGDVADQEFYGKVSRYENISELLKNLELTGMVNFKVIPTGVLGKGRRVIVMP